MIDTWLTDTFGLSVPVVGAPMAGPGEGALAAAVSAAGGLGMVGVNSSRSADWVVEQAEVAAAGGAPYGVGLMAWVLEQRRRTAPGGARGAAGAGVGELRAVREVRRPAARRRASG